MGKSFDDMTRGEQFLHLTRIEYQDLIRHARFWVSSMEHSLETYTFTVSERDRYEEEIRQHKQDIRYYTEVLQGIGAENEEPLTEIPISESPFAIKFTGVTCTTVL